MPGEGGFVRRPVLLATLRFCFRGRGRSPAPEDGDARGVRDRLQVASLAQPSALPQEPACLSEREANKETVQLPTSLPRLHLAQHRCAPISFARKIRHVTDTLSRCRSLFASVSERTCFRHATTSRCRRSRLCDMSCQEHGEIRVRWEREAGGRMKADAI